MSENEKIDPKRAMNAETDSLSAQLWRLGKFTAEKVASAKNRGELVQVLETYVRWKITKFEYSEDGNTSRTSTHEYFNKETWHWRHQHEFITEIIKENPISKLCLELIAKASGGRPDQSEFRLHQFLQAVSNAAIEGSSEDYIIELGSRFIGDLNMSPMNVVVTIWITGLWLKDERVKLPRLTLRRPMPSDLEHEEELSMVVHGLRDQTAQSIPSSIAELEVRATTMPEAQEEVSKILNVLRLFRLGAVDYLKYSMSANSLWRIAGTLGGHKMIAPAYKYSIRDQDMELLNRFLERVKPIIVHDFIPSQTLRSPTDLALLRYSDALLRGGDIQHRITTAITCLEALFLKGKERAELSHRLGLRIASLLRLLNFNPFEIQTEVHQAYEIRSTYIHGGQVEDDRLRNATTLCEKITEYARLSVVIFLQLKNVMEKDDFITKLDNALLEPKSLEKVKKHLDDMVIPK